MHDGAASGARPGRRRTRRRSDLSVVHVHRHRKRRSVHGRHSGLCRYRTGHLEYRPRRRTRPPVAADQGDHPGASGRACRRSRSPGAVGGARRLDRRRRGLRRRIHLSRAPDWLARQSRLFQFPSAQDDFDWRRRYGDDRRPGNRRARAQVALTRGKRVCVVPTSGEGVGSRGVSRAGVQLPHVGRAGRNRHRTIVEAL